MINGRNQKIIESKINQRLATKPQTIQDLYNKWEPKIRTTVRNREKITEYEVDDVVQTIFLTALDRKWLEQYDGSTAFSTFLYTYVLQEIQNYINKRDSANTVRQTGARRYTRFSSIAAEEDAVSNLIDKLSFNCSPSGDEYQFSADCNIFYEKAKRVGVFTLIGYVSFMDILEKLLLTREVHRKNKRGEDYVHHRDLSNKEIANDLGVDITEVNRVITSLYIFTNKNVSDALDFIDSNFLRIDSDEFETFL